MADIPATMTFTLGPQMTAPYAATGLPLWIRLWFALDAAIFLFPPIYWATNSSKTNIFDMPVNLLYFVLGCSCITASVVAAYVVDPARRELVQ